MFTFWENNLTIFILPLHLENKGSLNVHQSSKLRKNYCDTVPLMFVSSKTAEYPVPLDYIAVFGNYKEHALQVYCTAGFENNPRAALLKSARLAVTDNYNL